MTAKGHPLHPEGGHMHDKQDVVVYPSASPQKMKSGFNVVCDYGDGHKMPGTCRCDDSKCICESSDLSPKAFPLEHVKVTVGVISQPNSPAKLGSVELKDLPPLSHGGDAPEPPKTEKVLSPEAADAAGATADGGAATGVTGGSGVP